MGDARTNGTWWHDTERLDGNGRTKLYGQKDTTNHSTKILWQKKGYKHKRTVDDSKNHESNGNNDIPQCDENCRVNDTHERTKFRRTWT